MVAAPSSEQQNKDSPCLANVRDTILGTQKMQMDREPARMQLEAKRLFKCRELKWLLSELCGLSSACSELASACPVQRGPLLLNPR